MSGFCKWLAGTIQRKQEHWKRFRFEDQDSLGYVEDEMFKKKCGKKIYIYLWALNLEEC